MQCHETSVHFRCAGMRSSSAPSFNNSGTESFNGTSGLNASGSPPPYVYRDTDPLPVSSSASISEEVDLGPAHDGISIPTNGNGTNGDADSGNGGGGGAGGGAQHGQQAPMQDAEWERGLAAAFNGTALGVDSRKFGDAKKMVRANSITSRALPVALRPFSCRKAYKGVALGVDSRNSSNPWSSSTSYHTYKTGLEQQLNSLSGLLVDTTCLTSEKLAPSSRFVFDLTQGLLRNWPPGCPLVYHSISVEVPRRRRRLVRGLFFAWAAGSLAMLDRKSVV